MKRLFFVSAAILLLLISASFSLAQKGMKRPTGKDTELPEIVYRECWLLAIGVNKYPYLPSRFQLNYAVADAEAFAEVLQNKFGFDIRNVTILRDKEATKSRILNELNNLADHNRIKTDDCVIVYFSGHGQTATLPRGGDIGFLVPSDAKVDLSGEPNLSEYKQYCIDMNQLKEASNAIAAKHILFIIDACYGGLALTGTRGLSQNIPGYLSKVVRAPTQQMITAGGKDEVAQELSEIGHGVFTYKLIEGLKNNLADGNNDGVITGTELAMYVENAVQQKTNGKQNPQFRREDEGEILFIPQIRMGKLQVFVDPPDAKVKVTDSDATKGFNTLELLSGEADLPEGIYKLTAEKDDYETVIQDQVRIVDNVPTRISLSLKRKSVPPAVILIKDLSDDIIVYVNDSKVKLPHQVSPGTYKLRFERGGFKPIEITESLKSAQTFSPDLKWIPIIETSSLSNKGVLSVQISPPDAKVSITSFDSPDSFDITTSGEINLSPGMYAMTVRRNGYNSELKNFNITANTKTHISLTLKPKEGALATITDQNIPQDARVFINGSLVKLPYQIAPGNYNIRLERQGYKPIELAKTIEVSQSVILNPSWEPILTRGKGYPKIVAFSASLVVPGLGQHIQKQNTRGYIYEGLVIATGIAAIIGNTYHNNILDDYENVRNQIISESQGKTYLTPSLKSLYDKQKDLYNKAKSARNLTIAAQVILGLIWGINAIDAGILTEPELRKTDLTMSFQQLPDGGTIVVKNPF
ncbi:MAG: caspase family protein [bacterium]